MISTKLTGETVPAYDVQIDEYLRTEKFDGGGTTMRVGVENESQQVYRIIDVSGLADFLGVIDFLGSLDLTDILENKDGPVKGFDAQFRP